jgi:hypothetical protein
VPTLLYCKTNKYIILWVCVCSLGYPACNAHASYCHLWPLQLYYIFPRYLTNGTMFEKKFLNTKYLFWFYLQLLSVTFLIIRRSERHMTKIYIGLNVKYPLFWLDFNETWIFSTDFRKILKYQMLYKSVQWEPRYSKRTDRQIEMTKLIVAFCNSAKAPKKDFRAELILTLRLWIN